MTDQQQPGVVVNEKTVAMLEKYLAQAKNGQVISALVTIVGPMNQVAMEYSVADQQRFTLMATVPIIQNLMIKDLDRQMTTTMGE